MGDHWFNGDEMGIKISRDIRVRKFSLSKGSCFIINKNHVHDNDKVTLLGTIRHPTECEKEIIDSKVSFDGDMLVFVEGKDVKPQNLFLVGKPDFFGWLRQKSFDVGLQRKGTRVHFWTASNFGLGSIEGQPNKSLNLFAPTYSKLQ